MRNFLQHYLAGKVGQHGRYVMKIENSIEAENVRVLNQVRRCAKGLQLKQGCAFVQVNAYF